ncbi:MAG: TerB family tellurite resistance protein [Proteobacteria bacterium]|nr:TerB family tellurite resistance protein [Pseudomonadota bacterium]
MSVTGTATQGGNLFRDVRNAFGELFSGKLDARQELLIQVSFGLLGAMARADGVVSTEEAAFTNTLMDELKLNARARQVATEAFATGCRRDYDANADARRLLAQFKPGSSEVERLYSGILRLAAADARIRPGEARFLKQITTALGFPDAELQRRMTGSGGA